MRNSARALPSWRPCLSPSVAATAVLAAPAFAVVPDTAYDAGPGLTVAETLGIFVGHPAAGDPRHLRPGVRAHRPARAALPGRAAVDGRARGGSATRRAGAGAGSTQDAEAAAPRRAGPRGGGRRAWSAGDEVFTDREREDVERARRIAEAGHRPALLGVRRGARRRLARDGGWRCTGRLPDPRRAVLLAVDPGVRRVEIVTGSVARRWLDDRACGLAVLAMTTSFGAGDLAAGIVNGLRTLGRARAAPARPAPRRALTRPLRPTLTRTRCEDCRVSVSRVAGLAAQRALDAVAALGEQPGQRRRRVLGLEVGVGLLGDLRLDEQRRVEADDDVRRHLAGARAPRPVPTAAK